MSPCVPPTRKPGKARAEIAEFAAIADYSRTLRRIGYHSADNSTVLTVAALFNAGVFAGGGVSIGTHAFGEIDFTRQWPSQMYTSPASSAISRTVSP
jgi:hypothetical protein